MGTVNMWSKPIFLDSDNISVFIIDMNVTD